MQRSKKLLSFVAILLLMVSLLTPLFQPGIVHADPGVPGQDKWNAIPITTCQGLRDINNNLSGTYTLSNNLNCIGFISVGKDDDGNYFDAFRGRLYGQGHTISGLQVPLFSTIYGGGIIANLQISTSQNYTDVSLGGALAETIYGALISDVHANVTAVLAPGSSNSAFGGLVANGNDLTIIRSSAVVNIQMMASQINYGGLVASLGSALVRDSFADTTMSLTGGGIEHAGGLAAYGQGVQVQNSYATGTIDNPSNVHEIGGLIWDGQFSTAVNSFSTFQGAGGCNGTDGCSGLITAADEGVDLSTDYFDQTAVGTNRCTGDGTNASCNRVNTDGSQGNYFKNNSVNGPLSSWDFSTVWNTTAGLPTLRNLSDPSPFPDPVENLESTINSSTSIGLNWAIPADTGSASPFAVEVNYQEVGASYWSTATANIIYSSPYNFKGTDLTINNLKTNTSYIFEVVLYNQDGYVSVNSVNATTPPPGFAIIHTCQQLQDITANLADNFALGENIDCSGSASMNGGEGFRPIGCYGDGNYNSYTGAFTGNNYTISNLYVDGGDNCYWKALFIGTQGALIQDFSVVNPIINGSSGSNYKNAVITVDESGSTFNNIHVRADGIGEDQIFAAGLIGRIAGSSDVTTIDRVSFVGTVNGDMSANYGFGGLIGRQYGPTFVTNSYAQSELVQSAVENGGGNIGGLVASSGGALHLTNSYASLNYDATGSTLIDGEVQALGGLIGGVVDGSPSIDHSFARTQAQGFIGDQAAFGGLVGFIYNSDADAAAIPVDFSGSYFDADRIGVSQCVGSLYNVDIYGQSGTCDSISGQPNYFNNNSTNPPLNSWDFNNIWATTSTLPVFARKSLTTVTPIPPGRLVPVVVKPVTPKPITIQAEPIRAESVLKNKAGVSQIDSTTPTAQAPQGIIAQLKQLLGRVPSAVLVSFPYLLFGLLLLAALALLIEMLRQARRLKELNLLLAKQRSVAEKRDTFWHLAANYLRAPITLLMGGADLLVLSKADSNETHQLTSLSQRLQTKVAGIMQQIEQSHTLQDIKPPKAEKPRRVWSSPGFWLPVVVVATLIIFTNYVAQSWRGLNLSAINLATQVVFFLLASIALYWVLGALGMVSGRRRSAERLLVRQERALDEARLHLMSQTATGLDSDVNQLQGLLGKLSARSQAKPIMQEGASRLRHLVDSFSLLISAQNHRLGGLSPAGAHTSLDQSLKAALAELEPQIIAKGLTIDAPAKLDRRVPGKADLNNQVLSSVLANAIAFSPSGSTIRLDVDNDNEGTRLTVADHGPGISPTQQAHLFEPFTKADGMTGLQLDHDGLGINLYLNRQIMDYLGGQIDVNSTAGQGTVVEMYWPQTTPTPTHPGALVHPAS